MRTALQRKEHCARATGQTGRVLVIRAGAVGDFIVTLPVLHLVRNTYRSGWLGLVGKSRVRSLVRNVVDEFIDIDGPMLVPFFHEKVDPGCPEYRYLNGFDLVISYLGVRGTVSENLRALSNPQVINAAALPPPDYDCHITEFLLAPLSGIMDVSWPSLASVTIGASEEEAACTFLSSFGIGPSSPMVAVHPGSGSRRKVSPAKNFCGAGNWIRERFPKTVVLVIEGEADEEDVRVFERGLKAPCVRVKKEDLLEVAAILSRTSLFIGNDSGIAHLAAAVGVPTVVVFRASNPAVWAPRGKNVWVASDSSLMKMVKLAAPKILGS